MTKSKNALRGLLLLTASLTVFSATGFAADLSNSAPSVEQSPFYVRGDVGWSMLNWNGPDDSAVTAGVGLGYMWNEVLRSDVRLDWSGNYDIGTQNADTVTLLGNAYIDIPLNLSITPYVGAGAGYGWMNNGLNGDDSGFTYSLMAGATFDLSNSMALDAQFRYRDLMIGGPNATDESVTAGILFRF